MSLPDSWFTLRALRPEDATEYVALRARMLHEHPLAFSSSPAEDVRVDREQVAARLAASDGSAIYGAFTPALEGAVGIYREGIAKAAHKAQVWGMYVAPRLRGHGTGRALIEAVIAHARGLPGVRQVHIGVTDAAPAARRVYLAAGFRAWGLEPDALCHAGRCVAEEHLVLTL